MWSVARRRTNGARKLKNDKFQHYVKRTLGVENLEPRRVLATFVVSTVDDAGPGSLRQAILDSNARLGPDEIQFSIPLFRPLLRPTSLLPEIVDEVIIDATTQPGYIDKPLVQVDGELVTTGDGFRLKGSATTIRGLSITGFRRAGIFVDGAGGNVIEKSYIGVDLSGTTAVPNQFAGIIISNSARNRIGGPASTAGNLISGNAGDAIRIEGSLSTDNIVQGNLIGTDAQGLVAVPNVRAGVLVQGGARNTTIGSDSDGQRDEEEGNLISGNLGSGIALRDATTENAIAGNWIGTDISGNNDLGNAFMGIAISGNSHHNLIGTENGIGEANVVSGNDSVGLYIENAQHNVVAGNLIGVNSSGNAAVPNARQGVLLISGSQHNRIGTDDNGVHDASERNVISGNVEQGITIAGEGSDLNWVAGNFIGTDATGQVAVPNTSTGIQITNFAQFNRVGRKESSASNSSAGNVISGNSAWGIRFRNHASDNTAAGNLIGTDASGMRALPNLASGIGTFELATGNVIGGAAPHLGNVISGNVHWGIQIESYSGANTILGNSIGLAADGRAAVGNGSGGISVESASSNHIGDGTISGSNQIAFNSSVGIVVTGSTSLDNSIAANNIFSQPIGIDLGGDGLTPNDVDDLDQGPNLLQNYPEVVHVAQTTSGSEIAGTFQGSPQSDYRFEFFASDPSLGTSQGGRYLGHAMARTNQAGYASWQIFVSETIPSNEMIASTASDSAGNTSEFSDPKHVTVPLELEVDQTYFAEDVDSLELRVGRGSLPLTEEVVVTLTGLPSEVGSVPAEIVIAAGEHFASVSVTIFDDNQREQDVEFVLFASTTAGTASGATRLNLVDDDTGDWHNLFLPEDINGDRIVSPLDVLLIVNFLNGNSDPLVSQSPPALPRTYLDTDNNGLVSPTDVLLVINYLNSQGAGEGEVQTQPPVESASELQGLAGWDEAWWRSVDDYWKKQSRQWHKAPPM